MAIFGRIQHGGQSGTVLLMAMVLFGVLLIILVTSAGFINRQFRITSDREQEEKAFHAAEAGLAYAAFLLRSNTCTSEDLITDTPCIKTDEEPIAAAGTHDVGVAQAENASDHHGTFTLSFLPKPEEYPDSADAIRIVSAGRGDGGGNVPCREVVGTIARVISFGTASYQVVHWEEGGNC